jgi:transaldolase
MNARLKQLSDAGVSIWLDDLSRERLETGSLAELITEYSVVGVTTNPTIFAAALAQGPQYGPQLEHLGDVPVEDAIKQLCTTDVRNACDLFEGVYRRTDGFDGRVSIEVEPRLAHDTARTIEQARELHELVGRENVLIKIPATLAGLPAIRATIASGISVNVTLIFSVARYREVMDAYLSGVEDAAAAGLDLSSIHSVASFFISRVDTEIDRRLSALGRPELKGRAAVANAIVAHAAYQDIFSSRRFSRLAEQGANVQRPLWASTGTKDPSFPDTAYVAGLIASGVVNTMPESTLLAFADHGELDPPISQRAAVGQATLDELSAAGVDLEEAFGRLEEEGVEKFNASWRQLVASVRVAQSGISKTASNRA